MAVKGAGVSGLKANPAFTPAEKVGLHPQPAPTSSGLRELKESAVVSEETDSEWRRLGPAEVSETCRERVRVQVQDGDAGSPPHTHRRPVRQGLPQPTPFPAQACDHPRPAHAGHLQAAPPTDHQVPCSPPAWMAPNPGAGPSVGPVQQ